MPYKCEKLIKLAGTSQDRRKLSDEQKDEDNDCYFTSQGMRYKYCKPFNPSEYINVAEDLKEYEK